MKVLGSRAVLPAHYDPARCSQVTPTRGEATVSALLGGCSGNACFWNVTGQRQPRTAFMKADWGIPGVGGFPLSSSVRYRARITLRALARGRQVGSLDMEPEGAAPMKYNHIPAVTLAAALLLAGCSSGAYDQRAGISSHSERPASCRRHHLAGR